MSSDIILRQEIQYSLGFIRSLIHNYSGLYPGENLTRDVLQFCDEIIGPDAADGRLNEARRLVEERCRKLAQATDRFSDRDPAVIAALRIQAVAAVDQLQDAIFQWHKARMPVPSVAHLLRRKSL